MNIEQHTDKKQNIGDSPPIPAPPSQGSHAQGVDTHDFGKHPPIAAERIFDNTVYYGWNYGLQVFASVCAAMWFKEGKGKPYFDRAADWMGEHVMSKITNKTGEAAAKSSHSWLTFASLIMVGNLFIPPIQWVEKRKSYFVEKINDQLNSWRTARGNAPTPEEIKVQQHAIHAIANEPQQTSASLWGGRVFGLGANFLASYLVTQERDEKMQHAFANGVSKVFDKVGAKNLAISERVKSFSRIAILDYGYSIISANVIYLYSHFINPPKAAADLEEVPSKITIGTKSEAPLEAPIGKSEFSTHPAPQLLAGSEHIKLIPTNPDITAGYDTRHAL